MTQNLINSYQDFEKLFLLLKRRSKSYFNVLGPTKSEREFYGNLEFLKEIYNSNQNKLKSQADFDLLKESYIRIPHESLEEKARSISMNLNFDFDSMNINLPQDFEIHRSESLHPENIIQYDITYSDPVFLKGIKSIAADFGFYLSREKSENFLTITGVQGRLSTIRFGFQDKFRESDDENYDVLKKRSIKAIKRVFGKLNHFYGEDWRVGIIREIKKVSEEKNLGLRGFVPGTRDVGTLSIPMYPMYSIYTFNSFLKAGICEDNIYFSSSHPNLEFTWDKIRASIKGGEPIKNLDNLSGDYARFYKTQIDPINRSETFSNELFMDKFQELAEKYFKIN